jgi:hypothetical protein
VVGVDSVRATLAEPYSRCRKDGLEAVALAGCRNRAICSLPYWRVTALRYYSPNLLLWSCTPVRIAQINADPLRYEQPDHKRAGSRDGVTESAGRFLFGGYQVSDGTAKIYVLFNARHSRHRYARECRGPVVGAAIEEHNHHVEN